MRDDLMQAGREHELEKPTIAQGKKSSNQWVEKLELLHGLLRSQRKKSLYSPIICTKISTIIILLVTLGLNIDMRLDFYFYLVYWHIKV